MKIIQICNLPIHEIFKDIKNGKVVDRHNTLYGYDFLIENNIDVVLVSSYKKNILSILTNKLGYLIWRDNADYYLQVLATIYAKKHNADGIYCHFLHIAPLLSFLRKIKLLKRPLLVIAHDAFSQSTTQINTWKGIDRVLTLCESTLELCKTKEDLSNINCGYIDWGADLDMCDNYYNKQIIKPKYDSIIATGVANRDYDTIINAIKDIPSINLNIFSSNCEINTEKPANVFIDKEMNRSSTNKLLPYYYNAIATAIPLNKKLDMCTGATILMESIAMRRPIIISTSNANLIDVSKEKIGFEIDYQDVLGWQQAIRYLIEHPDEAKEMGERGYFLAKNRYNYNNFCKQLLHEIEKQFKNKPIKNNKK